MPEQEQANRWFRRHYNKIFRTKKDKLADDAWRKKIREERTLKRHFRAMQRRLNAQKK